MRILVINLASIGDGIMRTPLTQALKTIYSSAKIDMLVVPAVKPIAEMDVNVDNVIVYDKKNVDSGIKGIVSMARRLRREHYDLAVCTNYALRGALISWLAGIKRRCGYNAQHAQLFLTDTVDKHPCIQYEAKNQLRVLAPLSSQQFDSSTSLVVSVTDIKYVNEQIFIDDSAKKIIFCPLSNFENRSLTISKGKDLLRSLCRLGTVFIIGSSAQREVLDKINSGKQAVVLAGNLSLTQLAALIKAADVMLSVDTGPMHMAVALKTKTVGLFGANHPDLWGADNENTKNFYAGVKCSPCWGRIDDCDKKCLEIIDNSAIINAVKEMLA
ncbi:MAG: glycosyltransferase family 9 protein [Negativicutes bacterium]|jgi:lipopolysaccharide heptosyltransferase II